MDVETPWSWRTARLARNYVPWKGDLRKYRAGIQDLMIRTVDTNRYCADCGIPHRPQGQLDIETPSTNGVAYANPWLGIFICHECAKCHEDLLPSPLNKIIYIFYNLHEWSLDDVAQMARWGNLRSQRYWLGNYRSEIKMWPTMIKPDRSAMTRKEWILRKYVKKEWALNPFPENQESLGPYNILEMRCVKQLKIMKWMPPPSRPCHTERTEEIDQNKCIESNVPQAPVPSVSSPIRESYNDVFVKTAREIPVEHSKAIVVRAATSIFATEEYEQAAPEPISDSPSTKNTEAPSMPKRETTPLATLAPSDDQASPSIPILSKSISRRPQSPTSDFSDDLYGTGRPLRPGLINSTEKVHAWRLSSIGNPPLSISPRQPWEELPPPPHGNQRIEHPSMPTFSLLIPVDLEDLAVGSGETVTEEDNSILADLNEAFLSGGKVEEDETRYLEDDETDVDSEMEKLVFQFEGVEKVKKGEGHRDNRLLEMDESEQTEDSESHGHGTILEGEAIQGDSDTWKGLAEEITARETREQCREAEDNLSTAFSYKTSFESSTTTENVPEETIVNHCQLLPVFTKSPLSPQTQSPIDFESDPEKETDKIVPMPPGTNEDAESRSPATTDPFASVLSSVRCRNDKRFGALDSHDVDEMAKQDLKLFILKSGLFSG